MPLQRSQERSDFLLFIFLQFKEMWVKGKSFCSRKDLLGVFCYKLSMQKIAQGYMSIKNFFLGHLQGRITYLLLKTV